MDNFVFDLNKFYENSRAAFGHTIRAAVLLGVLAAPELYAQDDPILPPTSSTAVDDMVIDPVTGEVVEVTEVYAPEDGRGTQ